LFQLQRGLDQNRGGGPNRPALFRELSLPVHRRGESILESFILSAK
jgi:hypothetical protein